MSVVGGRGEGIVVAIGAGTQVGRIASGLTTVERRRSPLQHELDRLVRLLLVVAVGLIVVTVGLGFARGNSARPTTSWLGSRRRSPPSRRSRPSCSRSSSAWAPTGCSAGRCSFGG